MRTFAPGEQRQRLLGDIGLEVRAVLVRLEGLVANASIRRLRERWSVRRSARQVVPWSAVVELKAWHLQLDLAAMDTPAFDWERAARKLVKKLPGSGDEG